MSLGFSWAISLTPGRRDLPNILSIIIPKFIMKELYYIRLDVHKHTVAIIIIRLPRMALNATKNPHWFNNPLKQNTES
jgi:hypothetical protein